MALVVAAARAAAVLAPPELSGFDAEVPAAPEVVTAAAASAATVTAVAAAVLVVTVAAAVTETAAAVAAVAAPAAAEADPVVSMASGLPSSSTDFSWNSGGKEHELGDKSKLTPGCPSSGNGMTTESCASVDFAATLEYK